MNMQENGKEKTMLGKVFKGVTDKLVEVKHEPPLISVLCPTRGRPELWAKSIESLLRKVSDPRNIEIITAVDGDDIDFAMTGAYEKCLEEVRLRNKKIFEQAIWGIIPVAPHSWGYAKMHRYYNELAERAIGEWLFIWNDDSIMETKNWDKVISKFDHTKPLMLAPWPKKIQNRKRTKTLFPIVSTVWFGILGHLSRHAAVDTWLEYVASQSGLFKRVTIDIFHERPEDKTAKSAVHTEDFHSVNMKALRTNDAKELRKWVRKQNTEK